jgi:DNA-binding PadR family transcriptional regulator
MIMQPSEQPIPPATFYVLFALAGGEKHGYAVMQEARRLSDGRFRIGPATLYTTVQRLLEFGWIEEVDGPEASDSRRRYYRLSDSGKSALRSELARMEAAVRKSKAMRLRLGERAS